MKKYILTVIITSLIPSVPAFASVTVDQVLTKEYMLNNGYSKQIYDSVNVSRARTLGKEYYTEEEKAFQQLPKAKKVLWRIYNYIDPAAEDNSFYHHNSSPVPHYEDL